MQRLCRQHLRRLQSIYWVPLLAPACVASHRLTRLQASTFRQAQHPQDISMPAEGVAVCSEQAAHICYACGLLSCSICSSSCPTPGGGCAHEALLYRFPIQQLEAAALRSTLVMHCQAHSKRWSDAMLCACMRDFT